MRKLIGIAVVVVLLAAAGCGEGGRGVLPPPKQATLTDLKSVEQLQTMFAAHAGEPRLVLLMSPT
jgi:hypothetical protein